MSSLPDLRCAPAQCHSCGAARFRSQRTCQRHTQTRRLHPHRLTFSNVTHSSRRWHLTPNSSVHRQHMWHRHPELSLNCQAGNGTCSNTLKVMIAGAPAAGKGTQCARILQKYGLVHISAGDLLRAEVEARTPAGMRAQRYMEEGNLVPSEVVVEMVRNRVFAEDAQRQGWLLDGFPRSAEQAEAIDAAGIRPDVFILINISDDVLVERVVGRRLDPVTGAIYHLTHNAPPADVLDRLVQRSDDTEEKLRTRLASHHANVNDVLGYYQDELFEVDGARSMEDVFASIDRKLAAVCHSRELVQQAA